MATRNDTATAEKQEVVAIKRTFDMPLATLWKAWTDEDTLKKWWGPEEYTCPDCHLDFRVDGKVHASMQGADGKKIWSIGTYKEIVPQKKIVITDNFADSERNIVPASYYGMPGEWSDGLVTVKFEEANGKTTLDLRHEGLPPEMIEDCTKGWQSSFDKLEELK